MIQANLEGIDFWFSGRISKIIFIVVSQ
jgi:hypothetical protein